MVPLRYVYVQWAWYKCLGVVPTLAHVGRSCAVRAAM